MSVALPRTRLARSAERCSRVRCGEAARLRARWLNPLVLIGGGLLAVIVLFVVVYPLISPFDPTTPDFTQPPLSPAEPERTSLGTDNFGRDILTRLAYGGRVDLVVAFIATAGTVSSAALWGSSPDIRAAGSTR